jgi:hypothetical protein
MRSCVSIRPKQAAMNTTLLDDDNQGPEAAIKNKKRPAGTAPAAFAAVQQGASHINLSAQALTDQEEQP